MDQASSVHGPTEGLLADRVAVVTGGARNLGREYCLALARTGASVAILDRDGAGIDQVCGELRAMGARASGAVVDVTDEPAVQAAVEQVAGSWGQIDVLVNNAALYDGLEALPPDQVDLAEWDRVMAVNVKGVFICARAVAAVMRRTGTGGSIINIASGTALSGPPFLIHYAASKGAVVTLTKSLARAYGRDEVRVNALAPGFVWDEPSLSQMSSTEDRQRILGSQLLQRPAQPSDIVGSVLYLASPLSGWVTGQTLAVNGGNHLH